MIKLFIAVLFILITLILVAFFTLRWTHILLMGFVAVFAYAGFKIGYAISGAEEIITSAFILLGAAIPIFVFHKLGHLERKESTTALKENPWDDAPDS